MTKNSGLSKRSKKSEYLPNGCVIGSRMESSTRNMFNAVRAGLEGTLRKISTGEFMCASWLTGKNIPWKAPKEGWTAKPAWFDAVSFEMAFESTAVFCYRKQ